MQINEKAPVVTKKEGLIDAPPETVWEILSAVDAWSTWHPEISAAALEGAFEPGTRFRWKSGSTKITSTLQVVQRPELVGWVGKAAGGLTARHVFHLDTENSRTRLTIEESIDGLAARLLRRSLSRTLDRSLEAWLVGIRRRAAGECPAPESP